MYASMLVWSYLLKSIPSLFMEHRLPTTVHQSLLSWAFLSTAVHPAWCLEVPLRHMFLGRPLFLVPWGFHVRSVSGVAGVGFPERVANPFPLPQVIGPLSARDCWHDFLTCRCDGLSDLFPLVLHVFFFAAQIQSRLYLLIFIVTFMVFHVLSSPDIPHSDPDVPGWQKGFRLCDFRDFAAFRKQRQTSPQWGTFLYQGWSLFFSVVNISVARWDVMDDHNHLICQYCSSVRNFESQMVKRQGLVFWLSWNQHYSETDIKPVLVLFGHTHASAATP